MSDVEILKKAAEIIVKTHMAGDVTQEEAAVVVGSLLMLAERQQRESAVVMFERLGG